MSRQLSSAAAGIASATRHVLGNGLVALILRNPASPTVSVRGEVQVGAAFESAAQAGLASFTGAALIRGTNTRSFQQIVTETEERGCSVNAGGGMHATGFGGRTLSEDLPLVLEILAEMVSSPTFPDQELERLRGQFLNALREEAQDTGAQAGRAAQALLYPANHPYSRSVSGTIPTVEAITRADLVAFHTRFHPALTRLTIVGDVDPPAVVEALERYFGVWRVERAAEQIQLPTVPALQGIQRRDIVMAGKIQSDLVWCVQGLSRTDPDYYPAMMANMILGRLGMGGRLGENVREKQGMAYYCYSALDADVNAGPWSAVAGVSPENVERALSAILHEVQQFAATGPTDEELADARAYLTGSLAIGLETNDGLAATLLATERYGLGLDYIERYPAIINGITPEAIVEVAQRYLSVEQYVVAVAGPGGAGER